MNLSVYGCTFVVGIDNGAEAFLPSCVPDLHFDNFLIDVDRFKSEVDSDGDHIVLVKIIISEAQQKRTLSDC